MTNEEHLKILIDAGLSEDNYQKCIDKLFDTVDPYIPGDDFSPKSIKDYISIAKILTKISRVLILYAVPLVEELLIERKILNKPSLMDNKQYSLKKLIKLYNIMHGTNFKFKRLKKYMVLK